MDISLSHLNLNIPRRSVEKARTGSDFSEHFPDIAEETPVTKAELLQLVSDPNSRIPAHIRDFLRSIFSEEPVSEKTLRSGSKQLFVHAMQLVDVVNFSANPVEVTYAETDLQFLLVGMGEMVETCGYKHALQDLVAVWKKLDSRSDAFASLEEMLLTFSKMGTLDLSGRPDLRTPEDKQKVTFELQYALWTIVAANGNLDRAKPVLAAFEESQQMRLAKLNFKGEALDTLVEAPVEADDVEGVI